MENYQDKCEEISNKLCKFINVEIVRFDTVTTKDRVREIVVAKLCQEINIGCAYNYNSDTFYLISMFLGELLVNEMGYNLKIAPKGLKFLCCDGKNLFFEVKRRLDTSSLKQSFVDCFNFLDEYRDEVTKLKLNKYCI